MKIFGMLCSTIILFLFPPTNMNAQQCDDCVAPSVLLYGMKVTIPMPPFDTLHTYYSGSKNDKDFFHWLDLNGITTHTIINIDPEKGCVEWYDGALREKIINHDSLMMIHVANYYVDLPHDGPINGGEYVLWGMIDSSGGSYRARVFLEDAVTRDQIAVGEKLFVNSIDAMNATDSALVSIGPVFDKIRSYQRMLRDVGDSLAIHARLKVVPEKISMKGTETINVKIQAYDCDGGPADHPLKNRWIKIKSSSGHFEKDSVQTDATGSATVLFHTDNITGAVKLGAVYFPYKTAYHRFSGAHHDTLVNVDYVPPTSWELFLQLTSTYESTSNYTPAGGYIRSFSFRKENFNGEIIGPGEFSDTSAVFKVQGYDGEPVLISRLEGDFNSQDQSLFFADLGGGSDTKIDRTNILGSPLPAALRLQLSGSKSDPNGIMADITLDNATEVDEDHYEHVDSPIMPSTTHTFTTNSYPDGGGPGSHSSYGHFSPLISTSLGNATFTKTMNGYLFAGGYSIDTTYQDILGATITTTTKVFVQVDIAPINQTTSVKGSADNNSPRQFLLLQNYPNPFNPSTTISYQLAANGFTTLKVYDAIGREVATLVSELKEAGTYSAQFDGSKLANGIFFARLQSGDKVQLKKMVLLK